MRQLRHLFSFILLVATAAGVMAAEGKPTSPPAASSRPPVAGFGEEQKMQVLRWLVKLLPEFATYVAKYPDTPPTFLRESTDSPRIKVIGQRAFGAYTVMLFVSAEFADDLSDAKNARFEVFNAHPTNARGTLIRPLNLPPTEMSQFCENPERYLEKKFSAGASR